MGFGVALIGYACLMLHEIGGGILAAPVLAYGFFLAARLNRNFFNASISSLFIFPRGIVQILTNLNIMDLDTNPIVNVTTFTLFIGAWLLMTFFWLKGVIEIAVDCGAAKLERQARTRLVITVSFLMITVFVGIMNMYGAFGVYGMTINSAQYILQYFVLFMNVFFMHTCFILITSEKQYAKDKQQFAIERAKHLEKVHAEKQEAKKRIEKRK